MNNKIYEGALIDALVTTDVKHIYDPISGTTNEKLIKSSDEIHAVLLLLRYGVIKLNSNNNFYCVLNINNDKDFKENIIKINKLGNKTNFIFLNKGDWSKSILNNNDERIIEDKCYNGIDIESLATLDFELYENYSINAKRVINNRASNIFKKLVVK